jgi:hypothetical protein
MHIADTRKLHLRGPVGAIVVLRSSVTPKSAPARARRGLRKVDGVAVVKNSKGDSWIGEVSGDLR